MDLCKQGISRQGNRVFKAHPSRVAALSECAVTFLYGYNPIRRVQTATLCGYGQRAGSWCSIYRWVEGESLSGAASAVDTRQLVRDLALFHAIFSVAGRPAWCLYRDAITTNVIRCGYSLVHIDFSSAHRFVHPFDDLALLLQAPWNQVPARDKATLLSLYMDQRAYLDRYAGWGLNLLQKGETTVGEPNLAGHYAASLGQMSAVMKGERDLQAFLTEQTFDELNPGDFPAFVRYRELRARFYQEIVWREP